MYDKLSELQASVTKTSTFSGAGKDFVTLKVPAPGDSVDFNVTAITVSSGTFRASVEGSTDNSTFVTLNQNMEGLITAPGRYVVPIGGETPYQYFRAVMTIGGSGSPSITYSATLSPIRS